MGIPVSDIKSEYRVYDFDGDGEITINDVGIFLDEFDGFTPPEHDLNDDGMVNIVDVEALRGDLNSYNSGNSMEHIELVEGAEVPNKAGANILLYAVGAAGAFYAGYSLLGGDR